MLVEDPLNADNAERLVLFSCSDLCVFHSPCVT